MQAFVPKNRRPRFELDLRIIDLNNIPLVSGTTCVKWRLPSSTSNETHGSTDRALILDHRASWNYEKTFQIRLTIDRNQTLNECDMVFEVQQEFSSGGHNEKNLLGRVKINLSEYVDKSDDDDGIVRRYLMQDSKINSTLKIGIAVRQVEGDRNFTTPPLKSAMAFGGITGVVASEQAEADDLGQLPSINTQSREIADMQEMYRRTLAASWISRSDELPADKLIEELFAGSVGWADPHDHDSGQTADSHPDELSPHQGVSATKQTMSRNRLSPHFDKRTKGSGGHFRHGGKGLDFAPALDHTGKAGSIEQQLFDGAKGKSWRSRAADHELSEIHVREDLRMRFGFSSFSAPNGQRIQFRISELDVFFQMLSQSCKGAGGLLNSQLLIACRRNAIHVTSRRHDVFSRSQNTASDSSDGSHLSRVPYRHKSSRRNRNPKRPQSRKVELDVTSLGQPGEVVVVRERKHRRHVPIISTLPGQTADKSALPFMLKDIEEDLSIADSSVIAERIESFRLSYQSRDKLSLSDWEDIRSRLQSSFTIRQLAEYIAENRQDGAASMESAGSEKGNASEWRPGTSVFLETGPAAREGVAERVAISQDLKGKDLLAERILRDCWQLGVINEIGQLDIRLPSHCLSLLLRSDHFSFEELASLHEVKVDVTHSLGLVRVTGKQRSCESIREIVHDTTNRIRQEELELLPPNNTTAKTIGRIFTSDFITWVSETYGVAFERNPLHVPSRIFYLLENKFDAENARRTLNLAVRNASPIHIPFSTYMSASEPSAVHGVDAENFTSWPDRQGSWFRWGISPTQATKMVNLNRSFFDKHQTRLSDELLKLLRARPPTANPTLETASEVHESVTAAVGRCLFSRKPFFEEKQASASELGKMCLPRVFTTDIPRAAHFLRMLTPRFSEEGMRSHLIRLVPSGLHASLFPQLELEVSTKAGKSDSPSDDDCVIRGAKAVLDESHVDYLLPEATLDIRFTRKLTHDLLARPGENCLEGLQSDLQDCFNRSITSDSEVPLPTFASITLPNSLLGHTSQNLDSNGSSTGEYMFLPVKDIQGTQTHQYEFRDQNLFYSFYESGPYNPQTTTELFLRKDLVDSSTEFRAGSENGLSPQPLQQDFNSFYNTACALAFELHTF
ncbi:hypothetical protein ARAM_005239 [Aspergillus rambellii]|uniref:C2 NT-type domain-containing protein n=1 Tax=Aspergillus rambellii TaxID=308745 RepID=A0A0F8XRV3_9EURO|nr:hypothetical protein ARAM_005239 [Aspergillus rambellii]